MNDDQQNLDASKTSRLRAFLWPTWDQRKWALYVQAWVFVVGAYLLLVPAWIIPQRFEGTSRLYAAVQWSFFMVEVFTDHIGLALLLILTVAAWRRKWRLAAATTPLVLLILGPLAWQYVPRSSGGGSDFRVLSVNLLCINHEVDALVREVRAADPDVILIQEYTRHWHDAFQRELLSDYPHHIGFPQEDAFGSAIYSRLPFREDPRLVMSMGGGDVPQIRAVVDVGGRGVVLYNIHLLPPRLLEYVVVRNSQFAALLRQLENEELPVVLSGDFNFPGTSPHARVLRRHGMTDAHDLAGFGRAATWPVNGVMRYLPVPGIRIDHVYLSPELTCRTIRTGRGEGSDHRPLIAELGFAERDQ